VTFVHLLATQLGDHFINVTDLPWGTQADPTGRHAVIVGTENRQNMLGHVALLGSRRPILPLAAGGAPEGRIGQPVTELLEAWAAAVRAGRTFATSGPIIELSVEGHEPGSIVSMPGSGGRLQIQARALAAQPVIGSVELVLNGRVVAGERARQPTDDLSLSTSVDVDAGSWIA